MHVCKKMVWGLWLLNVVQFDRKFQCVMNSFPWRNVICQFMVHINWARSSSENPQSRHGCCKHVCTPTISMSQGHQVNWRNNFSYLSETTDGQPSQMPCVCVCFRFYNACTLNLLLYAMIIKNVLIEMARLIINFPLVRVNAFHMNRNPH